MKYLVLTLLGIGLFTPVCVADDPVAPTVVVPVVEPVKPFNPFPIIPVPDTPKDPTPLPPNPDAVPILTPGKLFVVKSDAKFSLIASPKHLVNIRQVKGPRDISGVFVDGTGDDEDRTYENPFLAVIKAEKGKTGRVELIYIPAGAEDDSKFIRVLIDIGVAPQPPPNPDDPVIPTPTPAPEGFRALFIYKTTANLTREQYNILYSTQITKYLTDHCVKNGTLPEWRKWSPDQKFATTESKTMVDLFKGTPSEAFQKLPILVISSNSKAEYFPITTTDTEKSILDLLKSKGGE